MRIKVIHMRSFYYQFSQFFDLYRNEDVKMEIGVSHDHCPF